MTTTPESRLLELYDRVAEAPDAIERLRKFVLDLDVRGKLVEQDPADEPAEELLERIAAEKARLVKSGEIRTPFVPLNEPDLPPTETSQSPRPTNRLHLDRFRGSLPDPPLHGQQNCTERGPCMKQDLTPRVP